MDDRFLRIERLLSKESLDRLKSSRVAVVGLGAVGGNAVEALARSGVGHISIMDFDRVSITNINRQIIALESTIDESKVSVMASRLKDINPDICIKRIDERLTDENHDLLFEGADLVLDCIDSLDSKISLLTDAYFRKIPIVSSMGAALRKNPFLIKRADIFDTYGCPLARRIREGLRKNHVGRGIECIFSPEKVNFNYVDPELDDKAEEDDKGHKRRVLGSMVTITSVFGEYMAHTALEILLGREIMRGESSS